MSLALGAPRAEPVILTPEFISACDPAVSFDGTHILFAGKRNRDDPWQIWRMDRDGSNKIRISQASGDCMSPLFIGSLFYLDDKVPTGQIAYVGTEHGWLSAPGNAPGTALYACNADGTKARRITFNPYSDFDPEVLPNGRIVFSSRQPPEDLSGAPAMSRLLAVNIDGTDLLGYAGGCSNFRSREMARVDSAGGRVYFIESDSSSWPGGGDLAFVLLRRPLHSRSLLASDARGLFHSPCPLPDGRLFVSYRSAENDDAFGIYEMDASNGKRLRKIYSEPSWHCVGTRNPAPHAPVRGRSSVVGFRHKDTGVFFCLDAYVSDSPAVKSLSRGAVTHVRVIEALPIQDNRGGDSADAALRNPANHTSTLNASRRILGVAPVQPDGSFHIRVPAQTPITFQLLDENGMALAGQNSWTWVMPGESRGCIGCHEDREMAPPNRLAQAIAKPEVQLVVKPATGDAADFVNGIAPIIQTRCLNCHGDGGRTPNLSGVGAAYQALCRGGKTLVVPGSARQSPLMRRLGMEVGDGATARENASVGGSKPFSETPCGMQLGDAERTMFIEWVDLGAPFDGRAGSNPAPEIRGNGSNSR